MAKVIGLGGVLFKSENPGELCDWYRRCLALDLDPTFDGAVFQSSKLSEKAYSLWAPFRSDSNHFKGGAKDFMINFMVDDVGAILERVRENGGNVAGGPEDTEFGIFGWVIDPEGNKVELWQPA